MSHVWPDFFNYEIDKLKANSTAKKFCIESDVPTAEFYLFG